MHHLHAPFARPFAAPAISPCGAWTDARNCSPSLQPWPPASDCLHAASSRGGLCCPLQPQVLHKKAENQLRTVEQLGYIVWCTVRYDSGVVGLRFIIQSSTHDAAALDARIEARRASLPGACGLRSVGDSPLGLAFSPNTCQSMYLHVSTSTPFHEDMRRQGRDLLLG